MTAPFVAKGSWVDAFWKVPESFVFSPKFALDVHPTQNNRKAGAKPIQWPENRQPKEKGWGGEQRVLETKPFSAEPMGRELCGQTERDRGVRVGWALTSHNRTPPIFQSQPRRRQEALSL